MYHNHFFRERFSISNTLCFLDPRKKLERDLSFDNYKDKCSTLLHVEEIQMQKDIRTYDMKGVTFERERDGKLVLEVKRGTFVGSGRTVLKTFHFVIFQCLYFSSFGLQVSFTCFSQDSHPSVLSNN